MSKGKLKEEHQKYLFNNQDYMNRFNSVCPKDPLETNTKRPRAINRSNTKDTNNKDD